jgi:hypothetical protein
LNLRYFLTYRGTGLPLTLTGELAADSLRHRNTYIRAEFDDAGRLLWLEKLVYGEVELRHDYLYADDGTLCSATIRLPDDEPRLLRFDSGQRRP